MNERIKAMNEESTDQPDAGELAPDVPPDRHVPPDEDASSGENVSPENAPSAEVPPEETIDVELSKEAVALPQPAHRALYNATAFALSALLSPYLVIPVGTVGIVASAASSKNEVVFWTALSVLFSTVIPAFYVVVQILRGKITDVHVMEREQRGGPFLVAVLSSAIGALVLRGMGAPAIVWGIGVVVLANGVVLSWITSFWKISMHVAVLSATVIAALILIPNIEAWRLVWMIPALIWARATRGRHSVWQGLMGCAVAGLLTGAVFYSVNLWPVVRQALIRLG
jgi:hypothetical protein